MTASTAAPKISPKRVPGVPEPEGQTIYNRAFWMAYIANVSLVTANALTFRFAELVAYLGGTEQIAGTIVSAGVVAALVARLFLGQAIDRYGTRKLWLGSSCLFITACASFLLCDRLSGLIYAARLAFAVGLAGMFTCSIVHIQNRVPPHRRTEVIGNLGSSGFLGMVLGSQLGDLIFNTLPAGRIQFLVLFGGATILGFCYLALVVAITRGDAHCRPQETPAAHRLIFRYWPGAIVLVAIMMGVGLAVTTVFLTRFATDRGINGIGTFFTGYAVSAFVFRVSANRWSRIYGRHWMVLCGLSGHALGHCLLTTVASQWHFLPAAVACGFGHALLFPAVVSMGAGTFPREYRGTGTTIVLGFTELGTVLSAPVLGWTIVQYGFDSMFYSSAATAVGIGLFYALTAARRPDEEVQRGDRAQTAALQPVLATAPTGRPTEALPDESDESPPVPFPHVGRHA